ncbi:MAG: T9SS type A sorting domain-containing protein, partial [Bacteroidia bacterium]|nr:T9SS type A sorting domain-containing protein [Bacteroidia bacterium]
IELISVGRVNASFLKTNCPASWTYTVSSLPATGKDFAVTCKNNVFDLIADVAGFAFRPGRNGYIYAWGQNNTCTPVSGKLKIIIPSNVTFLSEKNGLPYTMSGDTVIFNFTNLNGFSIYNSNSFPVLIVNTNSTAQIGDSVCVTVIAEPMSGDANPTNNIVKKCFPVTNSYDPNEKQVGAPGMKANGDISTQATELNYTINFQNTGNDVAYDVFILDTLASNLDIKTLKINASSHFMRYYLIGNNVLKFEFDSIMLPDSTTNEAKSHGFVNYSISTKSGLAVGDKIENTGHIYFDFNSAIVTNTTLNTVNTASTTGLNENEIGNDRLSVFPNPFSGTATINYSLEQNAGVNLEVYNAIGENVIDLVNRIESSGLHQVQLSATDLSTGFYLVKLTINGTTSSKKIMLTK